MKHTFYAKYPVSVCLVVFKLIKPKGWRDLYFVLHYNLHFLTNHAVKRFKHNRCAFNPTLNVTIVLSLHLVSFIIQKLEYHSW